ncbi:MAG TPA: hypothetical protein VFI49_14965 [Rudaea sp.]|nr:hypothetical protein [Rudaea sp.]
MTPAQAVAFVERHGVVCEASRRSGIPSLVDEIAGEAVRGNWWSHPRSRAIFAATRAVRDSPDVLVCRLVDGKITFVHRQRWPALVRVADQFDPAQLARLHEVHSASGKHVIEKTPFPDWVPADVLAASRKLSKPDALAQLQILFTKEP